LRFGDAQCDLQLSGVQVQVQVRRLTRAQAPRRQRQEGMLERCATVSTKTTASMRGRTLEWAKLRVRVWQECGFVAKKDDEDGEKEADEDVDQESSSSESNADADNADVMAMRNARKFSDRNQKIAATVEGTCRRCRRVPAVRASQ
jgi:hypothetical protein